MLFETDQRIITLHFPYEHISISFVCNNIHTALFARKLICVSLANLSTQKINRRRYEHKAEKSVTHLETGLTLPFQMMEAIRLTAKHLTHTSLTAILYRLFGALLFLPNPHSAQPPRTHTHTQTNHHFG